MAVATEANQYIPFALEEVNLDFQVLGPAPNSPEDVEVLIAASRKEKIEDRVAAAEQAGLKAAVMDVDVFAAQTAFELIESQFPDKGKDQNIAIVDVGATVMAVNVLRNDQSIYMREQPSGATSSRRRSRMLRAFRRGAERRSAPAACENYESEVLQPFMDMMALEMARALQFFFTSTRSTRSTTWCFPAAAPRSDIAEARQRPQSITIIANPFANMALSPRSGRRI